MIKSNFTFGSITAEDDHFLKDAYIDNGDFEAISSEHDQRCFLIGRTGSGKSAALVNLENIYKSEVIRIIPENLSFPYLTNITVIKELTQMGVHLDPFFKALWKHIIIVEVLKSRYPPEEEEKNLRIFRQLKEKLLYESTAKRVSSKSTPPHTLVFFRFFGRKSAYVDGVRVFTVDSLYQYRKVSKEKNIGNSDENLSRN